jgi:hypothetical protein
MLYHLHTQLLPLLELNELKQNVFLLKILFKVTKVFVYATLNKNTC